MKGSGRQQAVGRSDRRREGGREVVVLEEFLSPVENVESQGHSGEYPHLVIVTVWTLFTPQSVFQPSSRTEKD